MSSSSDCLEFEIAIEMRLHGELGLDKGSDLDAHLASCSSCREFETRVRTIDRILQEEAIEEERTVAWDALRSRVTGWRSKNLLAVIAVAAFTLVAATDRWLGRFARSSSAGPGPELPLDLLLNVVAVGFIIWNVWAKWHHIRQATSPRYLTLLYRQDLAARIRSARVMTWFAPVFLFVVAFGRLDAAERFLYALFFAGLVWERLVVLPRLEREEQDLPFFDDFPHLF